MSNDSNFNIDVNESTGNTRKCNGCGANLKYKPGTKLLTCEYCGVENVIQSADEIIEELDYKSFLEKELKTSDTHEVRLIKCQNCGASTTFSPNITASSCVYCSTPLVIADGQTKRIIKPEYLLPFQIEKKEASSIFSSWISSLWFAPNELAIYAQNNNDKLKGLYIPYWTFDSETKSSYSGERGDHYYVTQTYQAMENGKSVTKTRQVRKTRWSQASGNVSNSFDDVLACASQSMPVEMVDRLTPWDLEKLVGYDDDYISGFISEQYSVELEEGFEIAQNVMDAVIASDVRRSIGGDEQRVYGIQTKHDQIKFKHILLPLWISSYRYKNKTYQFLINARTGELIGKRPYSFFKIAAAVTGGLIALGALFLLFVK